MIFSENRQTDTLWRGAKTALIQWLVALFLSFFLATFNSEPLGDLLRRRTYYRDIAITAVAVFLIMEAVKQATRLLDRRLPWERRFPLRLTMQVLFGFGIPALLAYLFAFLHYRLIDPLHVFGTPSFHAVEYPVALLMIGAMNTFFVLMPFPRRDAAAAPAPESPDNGAVPPADLICLKGTHKAPVPVGDIALIILEHGTTRVLTFDNRTYRYPEPLNSVMEKLDDRAFFRANRQSIVNRRACAAYHSLDFGKIGLKLRPPLDGRLLVISQKTAPAFRQWMEG